MERNSIAVPIYMKSIREVLLTSKLFMYWESPSHEGWLVILRQYDEDEESDPNLSNWYEGDCFLWNPSTFQTIMLPCLFQWLSIYYLSGQCCVLSHPPTNPDSMVYFLFETTSSIDLLMFCSPGDKTWRAQVLPLHANELIWCKASNKLYIATFYRNEIHRVEKLEPDLSVNKITITDNSHPWEKNFKPFSRKIRFVECNGELFKVVRVVYSFYQQTVYIKVSKLKYAASSMTNNYSWEEVKSMGDHVFYIGENTTATLSAAKLGLTKGCVYFTHTEDGESLYKFDLEDDSISVYSYSSNLLIRSNLPTDHRVTISNGRRDPGITEESTPIGMESITSRVMQPTVISPRLVFRTKTDPTWNFLDYNNNKYHIELPEILRDAEIRFSKGGWLLMLKGKNSLFFLNPFTRETIRLPDLQISSAIDSGICFSSSPTSLDCVVFAIEEVSARSVRISSISRGDTCWSASKLFNNVPVLTSVHDMLKTSLPWLSNPVFFKGSFYCLIHRGILGVFDERKECKWEVLAKPERPGNNFIDKSFLVECGGELLSVFLGHLGKDVRIFRLDSNMNWIKVESLGKHMLFISETCSISAIAPNSLMENKIYFNRIHRDGILYYCLDTSRYYSLGSQHSAENFYDTKKHLNCSWIEPNWSHSTTRELDWSDLDILVEKLVIS